MVERFATDDSGQMVAALSQARADGLCDNDIRSDYRHYHIDVVVIQPSWSAPYRLLYQVLI